MLYLQLSQEVTESRLPLFVGVKKSLSLAVFTFPVCRAMVISIYINKGMVSRLVYLFPLDIFKPQGIT